jgi:serine/threonine-protein kinase
VTLYRGLTGRYPFEGSNFNDLMFKIALEDPPLPTELVADFDSELEYIILRAMARDPGDRFQSADELREAVSDWLDGKLGDSLRDLLTTGDRPKRSGPSHPPGISTSSARRRAVVDSDAHVDATTVAAAPSSQSRKGRDPLPRSEPPESELSVSTRMTGSAPLQPPAQANGAGQRRGSIVAVLAVSSVVIVASWYALRSPSDVAPGSIGEPSARAHESSAPSVPASEAVDVHTSEPVDASAPASASASAPDRRAALPASEKSARASASSSAAPTPSATPMASVKSGKEGDAKGPGGLVRDGY